MSNIKIYLLSHLPVQNNLLKLVTGRRCLQRILPQTKFLAKYIKLDLKKYGEISALIHSSLPRAVETALICFEKCSIPLVEDDRITAIDYGDLHNLPSSEMEAHINNYISKPYPGGESFSDSAKRYRVFLDDMLIKFNGKQILLIGHNDTYPMLRHHCDGLTLENALRENIILLQNLKINKLEDLIPIYSNFTGPFNYSNTKTTKS